MTLENLVKGLEILKSHYKNGGNSYCLGTGYDVFYAYSTDTPLEEIEVEKMIELGWHQDCEDDFSIDKYDSKEGWQAFV